MPGNVYRHFFHHGAQKHFHRKVTHEYIILTTEWGPSDGNMDIGIDVELSSFLHDNKNGFIWRKIIGLLYREQKPFKASLSLHVTSSQHSFAVCSSDPGGIQICGKYFRLPLRS